MSSPQRRFTLTVVDSADWCADGTVIECLTNSLDGLCEQASAALGLVGVSIETYDAEFEEWMGPVSLGELQSETGVRISAESRSPSAAGGDDRVFQQQEAAAVAAQPPAVVPTRNEQSESMRREREQRSSYERAVRGAMAVAQERLEAGDFGGLPDDEGASPAEAASAGSAIQRARVACEADIEAELMDM